MENEMEVHENTQIFTTGANLVPHRVSFDEGKSFHYVWMVDSFDDDGDNYFFGADFIGEEIYPTAISSTLQGLAYQEDE
tara:strand:- start:18535 stop:18771 length:237 start_codon:yes stop_codon:yes gene_type:complete